MRDKDSTSEALSADPRPTQKPERLLVNRRPPKKKRKPAQPSFATFLQRHLDADQRFSELPNGCRLALMAVVLKHANGDGQWWLSRRTWAATAGVSIATIKRLIAAAEETGLIVVHNFQHANGARGANTYQLDHALVTSAQEDAGIPPSIDDAPGGLPARASGALNDPAPGSSPDPSPGSPRAEHRVGARRVNRNPRTVLRRTVLLLQGAHPRAKTRRAGLETQLARATSWWWAAPVHCPSQAGLIVTIASKIRSLPDSGNLSQD